MVWLQSGIWVEMIPPCKSLFSTWDPCAMGAGWGCLGCWLLGPWADWNSCFPPLLFCPSFYFPIPEKKEPCLQGEAEMKASKLFGK